MLQDTEFSMIISAPYKSGSRRAKQQSGPAFDGSATPKIPKATHAVAFFVFAA